MKLMITCKQATQYVSLLEEDKLNKSDRHRLDLHLFVCQFCKRFKEQTQLIGTLLSRNKKSYPTLSQLDKDAIILALNKDKQP